LPDAVDLSGSDTGPGTAVVVATQDHYDEEALAAALATEVGYVGLVASRRRAAAVLDHLRERGVPLEALGRVHAPGRPGPR
jgi:xanthine dehydrogenase accessory factor